MDELKEDLLLPVIGGEVVAYYTKPNRATSPNLFRWEIRLVFLGPDNRYKPAFLSLGKEQVDKLVNVLEEAQKSMNTLKGASFSGHYSKEIDSAFLWPIIEVKAEQGKIWTDFWLASGTYKFKKSLNASQVGSCITVLKGADEKGQRMINTLKALVLPNES